MPRPLHDTPIESSAWWACFQPERPVDGWCVYDLQCPKCTIKANVDLAHDPEITAVNFYDKTDAFRLGDLFGSTVHDGAHT